MPKSRTHSFAKYANEWGTRLSGAPGFYDFVVWNRHKRAEKLRYMHENPVRRGLVASPEEWRWSSYRAYAYEEHGPVLVNEQQPARLKWRDAPVA